MTANPWQQWQSMAALFAAPPKAPPDSSASPFNGTAERFMEAARAYLDGMAKASPPSATAAQQAARTFSDAVRDMFADFPQPWNVGFGGNPASGAAPPSAPGAAALGAGREQQERLQRMAEAWRRIDDAQRRLQRLWSDAMREAAAAFAVRLGNENPAAANPQAVHKIYDAWIDCAEEAYSRAAHSEAFCDALAECANAGSRWRRELQAGAEHSAQLLDLPTRSEINSLTLRVQSLETELRSARARAKTKAPAKPAPKPRRARRKARP